MSYTKHIGDVSVTVEQVNNECVVRFDNEGSQCHLFLGYVQLFGYVVLNYGFGLDERSSIMSLETRNSSWWGNKEYLQNHSDNDIDVYDRVEQLNKVPFISDNLTNKMTIGGKLGGVNDLVLEDTAKIMVDLEQRYFLQDLVYTFNSYRQPKPEEIENDGKVALKELTDNIVPFYSTNQSLLFPDLTLNQLTLKTYRLKLPELKDFPPTYNANLTGTTAEQGLISIRYLFIVGLQQLNDVGELKPRSIYFPFTVKCDRKGFDERWLQPDFLQTVVIDKTWEPQVINYEPAAPVKVIAEDKELESRQSFLEDLDKLIKSDLHNIPSMSTTERKKSISSLYDNEDLSGTIPQLSNHLKNQFNFLMNNQQLCVIKLSKGYYHIGDDIKFNIELNTQNFKEPVNKIIGLTAHLEAHEVFHMKDDKNYTNIYGVTPTVKLNTMAPTMLNSHIKNEEQVPSIVSSSLSVPKFASQQFQCSKFMSLKYFIVFKFNLMKFDKETTHTNGSTNGNSHSNGDQSEQEESLIQATNNIHLDSEVDNPYLFSENYWYDNYGNEFTFRLPLSILP